jgi:hypothetical protein
MSARTLLPLLALGFAAPSAVHAQIHVNEFMAANPGRPIDPDAAQDMDGDSADWIELRNTGASTNLLGCALSDDPANPGKWVFPSHLFAANTNLLVYASGKNRAVAGVQFHTNFKLSTTGEAVLFSRPDGQGGWVVVHQIGTANLPYPEQRDGISFGYPGNDPAQPPGYFLTDTPGVANGATSFPGFADEARFQPDRGYYDVPVDVTITTDTPGATLAYTFNGTLPSESNGVQVPPPDAQTPPSVTLTVADSTVIRARVFKTGLAPSKTDTHTYLFWERVKGQTGPLPSMGLAVGDTGNWGASGGTVRAPAGPDWEVDPAVTGDSVATADRFVYDDLKSIPTVSLVTAWRDMFGPGPNGGIYIGPEAGVAEEGVDRVASLELINPEGSLTSPNAPTGFQVDGDVHVFGGTSQNRWKSYKLSLSFKGMEDQETSIYGPGASTVQPRFILDARINQTWLHPEAGQRTNADYVRDQVMADLQRAMGGSAPHDRAVHLFINGLYWGLYDMKERPDHHFAAAYHGGDAGDYDVFKHTLRSGTNEGDGVLVNTGFVDPSLAISYANSTALANFNALLNLLGGTFDTALPSHSSKDMRLQTHYEPVRTRLDLEGFIDYYLLNVVAGNEDWSHKNYYASIHRTDPDRRWRYHSWDAEHVFKTTTGNVLNFDDTVNNRKVRGSPHHLHYLVSTNAEYRVTFGDRVHRHLFNGGPLSLAGMQAAFNARFAEIDRAIRGESARWGDNRRDATPYTRSAEWTAEKSRILNTILPGRHTSVLNNLRNGGFYPATAAPNFAQHGGAVSNGYALAITATAGHTIHYTLDGTDPRETWTGQPLGASYGGPVPLPHSLTVKARARNGAAWSALTEAFFQVGLQAAAGNLVISEIHYNPPGSGDSTEFIELLNRSGQMLDLGGVSFTGIDFVFPPGTLLAAGARLLVVKDRLAFELTYGLGHPIAGEFQNGTGLSNSGESLQVLGATGTVIENFVYPTPGSSDAGGHSLVRIVPSHGLAPTNYWWRVSAEFGGNPGGTDALAFTGAAEDDLDNDRLPALVEYALGTSDADAQAGPPGVHLVWTAAGLEAWHLAHPQADDVVLALERRLGAREPWVVVPPGLQTLPAEVDHAQFRLRATPR